MHPPYQPPQPPRKGMPAGVKAALFGCGGCATLLVLLVVASACLALVTPDPAPDGGEPTVEASTQVYAVGDTVTHGPWEITVLGVEEGVPEVVEEFGTETPQGQYVVVELAVKNVGGEPEYFETRDQVLMDTSGAMYRRDVAASGGFDWLEPVNPGNQVEGTLAFDVPEGFELSHLLVNGKGSFADGVRVDVD